MIKTRKLLTILTVFVFIFNLLPVNFSHAGGVTDPTLISVNQLDKKYNRPLITGLTTENTEVLVYMNGVFAGMATVNEDGNETQNFYFQPEESLLPGSYEVGVLARDKTSVVLSSFSNKIEFTVIGDDKEEEEVVENIKDEQDYKIPAPTLIEPNKETITQKVKPLILGLTKSGSKVKFFIDGVLNGQTEILEHDSGTANFSYIPFLNLSVGSHEIYVVAEDEKGNQSKKSKVLKFNIEEPLPVPVLKDLVVNDSTNAAQPFITGLTKNDLKVKIFINHILDGEFDVVNHESGTASFAYKPSKALIAGGHLVYATTIDERGKESLWSNIIFFDIAADGKISIEAEEEIFVLSAENDKFSRLKDLLVLARLFEVEKAIYVAPEDVAVAEELLKEKDELNLTAEEVSLLESLIKTDEVEATTDKEDDVSSDAIIEDILQTDSTDKEEDTGLINESKEKQGKLRWNLFIFIIFLVAVIVWIFWVNRELIKERQTQNKDDEKKPEEKKI